MSVHHMILRNFIFLLPLLSITGASAQTKLPVLHSHSPDISIIEGASLYQDIWHISPEANPDIFIPNPFKKTTKITFYSDTDSLSFDVRPGKKYNFIVLLNDSIKAYTQINTEKGKVPSLKPKIAYERINPANAIQNDTLPFTIGPDSGIHLKGTLNESQPLDLLFDTGAGDNAVTASLIGNKVSMKMDGTILNTGFDGQSQLQTSSSNVLAIGNLTWKKASMLAIDYKGFPFDVVLSWTLFEDKMVEIDYEAKRMIVHNLPYTIPEGYDKIEMKSIDGIHYIKCKLTVNGKVSEGWFNFDTGSDGTASVSQKFAAENGLNNQMKVIGTATTKGSAGIAFTQLKVLLPQFTIGRFELYNIPAFLSETDPENGSEHNDNIGNNILKRFNTIIDFRNNAVYLKPNELFYQSKFN